MQKKTAQNNLVDLCKILAIHKASKKRSICWLGGLAGLFITSGCSNHLYQGTTSYTYAGKTCQAHVSWTNTTHVFDRAGEPSDVVIRMASTQLRLRFTRATAKNDDALTLLLPSSEYADVINNSTGTADILCAVFEGADAHMQQSADATYLSFYCDKLSPKTANVESHMQARKAPYVFKMDTPITQTSLFSSVIETSLGQPDCRVSNAPAARTDK